MPLFIFLIIFFYTIQRQTLVHLTQVIAPREGPLPGYDEKLNGSNSRLDGLWYGRGGRRGNPSWSTKMDKSGSICLILHGSLVGVCSLYQCNYFAYISPPKVRSVYDLLRPINKPMKNNQYVYKNLL